MAMPSHDIPMRPYDSTAGREHLKEKKRPKTPTVDIHIHLRVPEADDLVRPHLAKRAGSPPQQLASPQSAAQNKKQQEDRATELVDMPTRLPDMDRMVVDVAALSCSPSQFYYGVDASLGAESCQIVNDGLAAKMKEGPGRHIGLGTVPLQDTDLAIKELKRCINELGFRGLQIGARVSEDEELSAPRLDPFWAAVQELDVPMLIHPSSFASARLAPHHFLNIIGNPLDTTVGVHHLIFDGVLERYPDLKFVLSHGGAFASHYFARMDHAYGARPDCRDTIHRKPSFYLRKFYFDTLVFSVEQLDFLIKTFGVDHVLIGTDYPFDMGEYDPVEHVYQAHELSEADREKICGLNALGLLKRDAAEFSHRVKV
jgi:aminocarboxymuconate-semialdehyde decarboxylase